jgi:tetratricopeptide (TPR) repeat protein
MKQPLMRGRQLRSLRPFLVFGTVLPLSCFPASVPVAAQTSDPIASGYMQLYAGQPENAQAHFDHLHARDPQALAPWFGALFVQMARIANDDSAAPRFEQDIDTFIDAASRRHSNSGTDSEAVFYLAQAYLLRSTYRLDYDKGMWGAARDAAKSKGLSDDYVKRHPEHGDAYLSLGLYNYYVAIAPNFVKVLRILLFLPSGDRAEGLKQLQRASREGSLFAPLAQSALADIYGSLEGRLAEALPLAEHNVQRFPGNADMRLDLAEMYLHPTVEDFAKAAEQYQTVIAAAREATPRQLAEKYRGMFGLANVQRNQWRIDEGIGVLTQIIDAQPAKPAWVMPTALLRRANYQMLLNDPGAEQGARRVLADPNMRTSHKSAQQLLAAIESRRKTDEGQVYAALIAGNRLVAQRRFDDAKAVYDRVGAVHRDNWQVRYRLAYLDFARARHAAAAAEFQAIASAPTPGWLKAAALLHLAWTHDLAGRRAEAVKIYKRIVDDHEDEGPAGAARLGLIAPYRGHIRSQASAVSR